MNNAEKILVDASRQAAVRHAGVTVECLTLQEAVFEFNRMTAAQQQRATIVCGKEIFDHQAIERLHYARIV